MAALASRGGHRLRRTRARPRGKSARHAIVRGRRVHLSRVRRTPRGGCASGGSGTPPLGPGCASRSRGSL